MSAPRLPDIDYATLTPEQRTAYDAIKAGPRGVVEGPLRVWVMNPGLAETAQRLGAYCRYGTALPPRLSELAILMVGAHWQAGFEWAIHAPIAIAAGVSPAKAEAIRQGQRPADLAEDEAAVHDMSAEMLCRRFVSDATYDRALAVLGQTAVIDLVGILGYYTLISMTINAFRVPLPEGHADPFPGAENPC
jgi:4-carboxymuconolactone decarboxylase